MDWMCFDLCKKKLFQYFWQQNSASLFKLILQILISEIQLNWMHSGVESTSSSKFHRSPPFPDPNEALLLLKGRSFRGDWKYFSICGEFLKFSYRFARWLLSQASRISAGLLFSQEIKPKNCIKQAYWSSISKSAKSAADAALPTRKQSVDEDFFDSNHLSIF